MIGVKIVQNIQTIYIRLKLDSPKILIMLANGILEKISIISFISFIANIVEEIRPRAETFIMSVLWMSFG